MAETLSQEEIDALLSALKAGQANELSVKAEKPVRKYDFRRPDKLSKEQLRTIQMLHDTFARGASTELSGYLRAAMSLSVISVDQVTYQEYIRSLADPTFMYLVPVNDMTSVIFEMSIEFVFALIDKLLGGPGKPYREIRELTTVEMTLMNRVMDVYLKHWLEAWEPIVEWKLGSATVEYTPSFVQIMPGSDVVVVVTYEAKLGDQTGIGTITIPYLVMEDFVQSLTAHRWFGVNKATPEDWKERLLDNVGDVDVEVSVVLGGAEVPMGQVLALKAGDVLVLQRSVEELIDMYVEGVPFAKGVPGIYKRRKAFMLKRQAMEGEE
ncbi:flagellar motor switch protein FliM [Coprothermobacteraceae bacterium]|nr:flagellar motor switch protein FliM [Coprothermobacteraceae bacterium]